MLAVLSLRDRRPVRHGRAVRRAKCPAGRTLRVCRSLAMGQSAPTLAWATRAIAGRLAVGGALALARTAQPTPNGSRGCGDPPVRASRLPVRQRRLGGTNGRATRPANDTPPSRASLVEVALSDCPASFPFFACNPIYPPGPFVGGNWHFPRRILQVHFAAINPLRHGVQRPSVSKEQEWG